MTRTRLYLEAMEEVLSQVQDKTIIDSSVKGLLPMLNLDPSAKGNPMRPASGRTEQGGVR